MTQFTLPTKRVLELNGIPADGYFDSAYQVDWSKVNLATYPIFDDTYRDGLNRKIVDHFWNREIGHENVGLFLFNLGRKLNEVMPFYNQMYLSQRIVFDPLATFDLTTIRDDTSTDTSSSTGNTTGTTQTTAGSRSVSSETPQTMLSGDEDYATSASDANSTSANTSNGSSGTSATNNGATNGNSHTTGYQGSAADLLQKFRATFLNIDMGVIGDLDELFLQVWGDDTALDHPYWMPRYPYGSYYGPYLGSGVI